MRRIICAALIGLAACGGKTAVETTPTTTAEPAVTRQEVCEQYYDLLARNDAGEDINVLTGQAQDLAELASSMPHRPRSPAGDFVQLFVDFADNMTSGAETDDIVENATTIEDVCGGFR